MNGEFILYLLGGGLTNKSDLGFHIWPPKVPGMVTVEFDDNEDNDDHDGHEDNDDPDDQNGHNE